MATVLIALCSGRKHGYTAGLWQRAVDGAAAMKGVVVDAVHLHDYRFGPCTSCFSCIRHRGGGCVLEDDFGRKGEGELYRKVAAARRNGLFTDITRRSSPFADTTRRADRFADAT